MRLSMRGVLVEKAGAPFTVVDGVNKPSPLINQILVKSIATAINPVPPHASDRLPVTEWPIVLDCDAARVVVEVRKAASSSFKVGDEFAGALDWAFRVSSDRHLVEASKVLPVDVELVGNGGFKFVNEALQRF